MNYQIQKLLLRFFLFLQVENFVFAHFRQCLTPLSDVGNCVSLKHCPEVLLLFQKLPSDQATKYSRLLKNICGNEITNDMYPLVCCSRPDFSTEQQMDYELIPVIIEISDETTEKVREVSTTTTTAGSQINTENTKIQSDGDSEKPCLGQNNEIGFCKPLENCPELFNALTSNPKNKTLHEYLRYSHETCDSIGTNVCCLKPQKGKTSNRNKSSNDKAAPKRPPTEDEGCGRDRHTFMRKIIGGQESEIGAWPWIALLGFTNSYNPFRCGGSLITARHVLTAAHCIEPGLSFVRLGEHDLTIEDETQYIDLNISKAIRHEKYSKDIYRFDVGLLFLERNVEFTDMISPICLPMSENLRTKSFVTYKPFAAGWGRTENTTSSNVLNEVQLLVYNNSICRDVFKVVLGHAFDNHFFDTVLCVGDDANKQRDTCRGDSGGPLMIAQKYKGTDRHYLIGITSYGIGCARPGVPSIYASTQYFMDWILQKIEES